MKKSMRDVDSYIASAPKEAQLKLREVREAIREVAPTAVESISYGMPGYDKGKVAWFGLMKTHIGLYLRPPIIEENKDEVMRAINAILLGKIAEYIEQINSIAINVEPLKSELKNLEAIEKEIRGFENSKANRETKITQGKKRISEINEMLVSKKREIEGKIERAYSKKIRLILQT